MAGIHEVARGIGDRVAIPSYRIAASISSASSVRGLDGGKTSLNSGSGSRLTEAIGAKLVQPPQRLAANSLHVRGRNVSSWRREVFGAGREFARPGRA